MLELTIKFLAPIEPEGTGMPAGSGSAFSFDIDASIPTSTALVDGDQVTNTAHLAGSNLTEEPVASAVVTVNIPRIVSPVATKSWSPSAALAGSGATSTISLGVSHKSSTSTELTELAITDVSSATYEYFDLTGVSVGAFPSGADRARLEVQLNGSSTWQSGAANLSAAGAFSLSVTPAQVTGVRVVFFAADGSYLPRQTSGGGKVALDVKMRETKRSDGSTISSIGSSVNVANEAYATGTDAEGSVDGAKVSAKYNINPTTISVNLNKRFFPDGDGDFSSNPGVDEPVFAIQGTSAGVSSTVSLKNTSGAAVEEMTITEPGPGSAAEWDKVDWSKARIRVPSGTTATVTFQPGNQQVTYGSGTHVISPMPVNNPTSVAVTFSNVAVNATVGLDLHGNIDDSETDASDLSSSNAANGIVNCVAADGGNPSDGIGTFDSKACSIVSYWPAGGGTIGVGKTASATSVVKGESTTFVITAQNLSKSTYSDVVINDTRVDANGVPIPGSDPAAEIWDYMNLETISLSGVPASLGTATIEVYVDGAWEPYAAATSPTGTDIDAFRVKFSGVLYAGAKFTINVSAVNVSDEMWDTYNCAVSGGTDESGNRTGLTDCVQLVAAEPAAGTTVNVAIDETQVHTTSPGMTPETAHFSLKASNTGNVSNKWISATTTGSYLDNFELTGFTPGSTVLPQGATGVKIDVFIDGVGWVEGTASAQGALPTLPDGYTLADVTQVRSTFVSETGIVPCTSQSCVGSVSFTSIPRPETPTGTYEIAVDGAGETMNGTATTPNTAKDSIKLIDGVPIINAVKDFSATTMRPGDEISATLSLTNSGTAGALSPTLVDNIPDEMDVVDASDFTFAITGLPTGYEEFDEDNLAVQTTYDPATGKLLRIQWTFDGWTLPVGAKISLTLNGFTLAPGVSAGTKIDNYLGTSADDEDLTCTASSKSSGDRTYADEDDSDYEVWCEDSDDVSVSSGSAFRARKWVGSAASTVWYNNATGQQVDAGDAACPSITRDGVAFTRSPCVVVLQEGDEFDWLLDVTNAGTEFASQVTIYDNYSATGDATAVGSRARNTQWTPTVTNVEASGATIQTTASAVACDSIDMRHDKTGCGSGWTAGFDGAALKLDWTFDSGERMAPGDSVEAYITSVVPEVAGESGFMLANNTFGHVETTYNANSGGDVRYLPGFESNVATVATTFGTVLVNKVVDVNEANVDVDGLEFEIDFECKLPSGDSKVGTAVLTVGTGWRSPVMPVGTVCSIFESNTRGGDSSHGPDNPAEVTILRDKVEPDTTTPGVDPVTITNSFRAGSLTVTKDVDGAGAEAFGTGTFGFDVACTFNSVTVYDQTIELQAGESKTISPLPVGADCTVAETAAAGADATSEDVAVTIAEGDQAADFTNTFGAGTISVAKQLDGAGAELAGALDLDYVFNVMCVGPDGETQVVDGQLRVKAGETKMLESEGAPVLIPLGSKCWATETDTAGAVGGTVDFDSMENAITIEATDLTVATDHLITATNTYNSGALTVTKQVENADNGTAGPFPMTVLCTAPVGPDGAAMTVLDEAFELSDGESKEFVMVSGSTCVVTETDSKGAEVVYAASNGSSAEGVLVAESATVAITNVYPEPAVVVPPTEPPTTTDPARPLPRTDSMITWAMAGMLIVIGGAVILLVARRKRQTS